MIRRSIAVIAMIALASLLGWGLHAWCEPVVYLPPDVRDALERSLK